MRCQPDSSISLMYHFDLFTRPVGGMRAVTKINSSVFSNGKNYELWPRGLHGAFYF